MSNYYQKTKNPKTGEWENAIWIDDYFGEHKYGVKFEDELVVDPGEVTLEVNDEDIKIKEDKKREIELQEKVAASETIEKITDQTMAGVKMIVDAQESVFKVATKVVGDTDEFAKEMGVVLEMVAGGDERYKIVEYIKSLEVFKKYKEE